MIALASPMILKRVGGCVRCGGTMTPYIDKGEDICISCGWIKYLGEIPPQKTSNKKRGRPRGYTRKGKIRLD